MGCDAAVGLISILIIRQIREILLLTFRPRKVGTREPLTGCCKARLLSHL